MSAEPDRALPAPEVETRGETGAQRHVVDVWMDEAVAKLTIEAAWHRAGIEACVYRRRAMDAVRMNLPAAAREWALMAAECEKAEDILANVGQYADQVRALIQTLKRDDKLRELRDEQARLDNEARKARWKKKRLLEGK